MVLSGCRSTPPPQVTYDKILAEMRSGDLDLATVEVDRAYRVFYPKNPEWGWRFRIVKAQILVSRTQYKDALLLLAEDLPPSLVGGDVAIRKDMVQAIAYRLASQFNQSEEKFASARKLAESRHSKFQSEVLNNQGALEFDQQNYPAAAATYRQALTLAREVNSPAQEATALLGLGVVATAQERYGEALDWNQAALTLARSQGMKSTADTVTGNMGWNYADLGDFSNALQLYQQAAEESERRNLPHAQAYWLTGIANSYSALHDYPSAEAILQHALKLARDTDDKSVLKVCLYGLATMELETDRIDLAEQHNNEAEAIERASSDQSGLRDSQLVAARIHAGRGNYAEAEKILRALIADPQSGTALTWESHARLAKVLDDENNLPEAERQYQKAIATIEAARDSLAVEDFRLTFISGGFEFYDAYVNFLARHGRMDDALRAAELSRARTLTEGLASVSQAAAISTRTLNPQQIAQKTKTTVLFYWLGKRQSYLWVIAPNKTVHFDLPKASEIEPLVASYRDMVLHIRGADEVDSLAGKQLYAMLVAPAGNLIKKNDRIIILPDDRLAGLNFETLVVSDPQPHFWIEDVTVTTASSLTLLAASTGRAISHNKSLMLVGDTIPPNEEFPALPNAAEEIRVVEKYFPPDQREVFAKAAATPTAYVRGRPERFAYLHFVTHGTASVTRPLESAVILSNEGDSYKLYAREIVKHPLTAQLVTISACEGAGRRAYSGEGLIGLSWAFLRAGAHNVVGALWEVSDASTPQFMDVFYSELTKGRSPASALRTAKLSLLHSQDAQSVFKKPYYWAPFQLYAGS
jgi:CHAT domain-containing protein